jgi:hypothetical protein
MSGALGSVCILRRPGAIDTTYGFYAKRALIELAMELRASTAARSITTFLAGDVPISATLTD